VAIVLRPSVKAVVVRDGRLLVTRNLAEQDAAGEWLLLPGGGQRPGETLPDALIREVAEETGHVVRPGRLLWVREYISAHHEFAHFSGQEHQIEFVFEAEAVGRGPETEPDLDQVGWDWVAVGDLAARRFYPKALIGPLEAFVESGPTGPVYLGDVN
jgi:8-oxo-dGTP diphosphatase